MSMLSTWLTGDTNLDQLVIAELMQELDGLHARQPALFERSRHRVMRKNANDQARYNRLLAFEGPDEQTLMMLRDWHETWLAEPGKFWSPPSMTNITDRPRHIESRLSRVVKRLACIALVQLRQDNKVHSREATAELLKSDLSIFETRHQAKTVLDAMIDAGYRYVNLEKHLGQGIAFVLGTKIAETCWTKLLPKRGDRFRGVTSRLRSAGVSRMANKYTPLRRAVVNWFLENAMSESGTDLGARLYTDNHGLSSSGPTSTATSTPAAVDQRQTPAVTEVDFNAWIWHTPIPEPDS